MWISRKRLEELENRVKKLGKDVDNLEREVWASHRQREIWWNNCEKMWSECTPAVFGEDDRQNFTLKRILVMMLDYFGLEFKQGNTTVDRLVKKSRKA